MTCACCKYTCIVLLSTVIFTVSKISTADKCVNNCPHQARLSAFTKGQELILYTFVNFVRLFTLGTAFTIAWASRHGSVSLGISFVDCHLGHFQLLANPPFRGILGWLAPASDHATSCVDDKQTEDRANCSSSEDLIAATPPSATVSARDKKVRSGGAHV